MGTTSGTAIWTDDKNYKITLANVKNGESLSITSIQNKAALGNIIIDATIKEMSIRSSTSISKSLTGNLYTGYDVNCLGFTLSTSTLGDVTLSDNLPGLFLGLNKTYDTYFGSSISYLTIKVAGITGDIGGSGNPYTCNRTNNDRSRMYLYYNEYERVTLKMGNNTRNFDTGDLVYFKKTSSLPQGAWMFYDYDAGSESQLGVTDDPKIYNDGGGNTGVYEIEIELGVTN